MYYQEGNCRIKCRKKLKNNNEDIFKQDDFKQNRIYELLRREGFPEKILSEVARNRSINDMVHKEVERQDIFAQYDFFEAVENS